MFPFRKTEEEKRAEKVLKELQKLAKGGDPDSQYELGLAYETGQGADQSYSNAAKWYTKAADNNHLEAAYRMGCMCETGQGQAYSKRSALEWFNLAANKGHAPSQMKMCEYYEKGRGVRRSESDAVDWCKKAADQGYEPAVSKLKILLDYKPPTPKPEKSVTSKPKPFKPGPEQKGRDLYLEGLDYERGTNGVRLNRAEAVKLYTRAAGLGYPEAMVRLGDLYCAGFSDLKQDYAAAIGWYRKAADLNSSTAMLRLSDCCDAGKGVPKSPSDAESWCSKAAAYGNREAEKKLKTVYSSKPVKNDQATSNTGSTVKPVKTGQTANNTKPTSKPVPKIKEPEEEKYYRIATEFEFGTNGKTQDYEEALKFFRKAEELRHTGSTFCIGCFNLLGRKIKKSKIIAFKSFQKAAHDGCIPAQTAIGTMYLLGVGTMADAEAALTWLTAAANAGETCAMERLSAMYRDGQGVTRSEEESTRWKKLAEENKTCLSGEDQKRLDEVLTELDSYRKPKPGNTVETDNPTKKKPEAEDPAEKEYRIAVETEEKGGPQALDDAIHHYRSAAAKGHAEAQYRMGCAYETGKGVRKNRMEADKWFKKAADLGHEGAAEKLKGASSDETKELYATAIRYLYGTDGCPKSEVKAFEYFSKAAEQDNLLANIRVGLCLYAGIGTRKDTTGGKAFIKKLLLKVEKEAKSGDAEANLILAEICKEDLAEHSDKDVFDYYMAAAKNGSPIAQIEVAGYYEDGRIVEQSDTNAFEWYLKAAAKGNLDAQFYVADSYQFGIGTEKSYEEATKWFRKAAVQGDKMSQFRLGKLYENGTGVAQNYEEAAKWYRTAAKQGSQQAKDRIKDLIEKGLIN